jgi:DNA ligase D-like protein (predicted 3'-phosphoesterase)
MPPSLRPQRPSARPGHANRAGRVAYSLSQVRRLAPLSRGFLATLVELGLVEPREGLRFSHQDLVVLRMVKSLRDAAVPPRQIVQALRNVKASLAPAHLASVRLRAHAGVVEASAGPRRFDALSGQLLLPLEDAAAGSEVRPLQPAREAAAWVEKASTAEAGRWRATTPSATSAAPPNPRARSGAARPRRLGFVIQKHWASRLHYDFRLELDGVMVSWAVPKGPSFDPAIKQMAIHVEDHPLSYNTFEGEIPERGSTAPARSSSGTVARGTPVGDPREGLAKGKLIFKLHGEKLAGLWELVRISKPGAKKQDQWLLLQEARRRLGAANRRVRRHHRPAGQRRRDTAWAGGGARTARAPGPCAGSGRARSVSMREGAAARRSSSRNWRRWLAARGR